MSLCAQNPPSVASHSPLDKVHLLCDFRSSAEWGHCRWDTSSVPFSSSLLQARPSSFHPQSGQALCCLGGVTAHADPVLCPPLHYSHSWRYLFGEAFSNAPGKVGPPPKLPRHLLCLSQWVPWIYCAMFYLMPDSPPPGLWPREAKAPGYLGHHSVPTASYRAGHQVDLSRCLLNNWTKSD